MLKIGIIGSGFGLYGLLPAFNSISKCEVVSICGKKSERLLGYCKSIGLKKIYSDWQKMLYQEKLDAVAIAVIPNAQYQIVKAAAEKGLHIFAEKPLAANLNQAKKMLALAKKKKITHAIDFIFPEIKAWKEVKKILDSEKFGKLKQILLNWDFLSYDIKNQISTWKTDRTKGGGALSYYFSHSLHYLEHFAGKISRIKSMGKGEVGVDVLLEFKNGVTGNTHLSCNNPDLNKHQLIFTLEKGTIILENQENTWTNFVIKICANNMIKQINLPKEKIKKGEDERVSMVKKNAIRFINACIHQKQTTPSFVEGVRVQQLIEKIRTNP